MKCTKLLIFIFTLLFYTTLINAQDLTGVWKGEIINDPVQGHPAQNYSYEITISENNGKLTGYAYVTFIAEGKEQIGVMEIKVKQKDNIVIIEDDGYIDNNFTKAPPKQIKKRMTLTYEQHEGVLTLSGQWRTNPSKVFLVVTGSIFLQRKTDFKQTALYKKLDSLKLAQTLVFNPPPIQAEPVIAVKEPVKEEVKPVIVTPPPVIEEPKKAEPIIAKVDTPKIIIKPVEPPVVAVVKKPEPKPVVVEPAPKPIPPAPKPTPPPVAVVKPQPKPTPPPVVTKPQPKPVPPPVAVVKAPAPPPPATPAPVVKKPVTVVVPDAIAKNVATGFNDRKTNTLQTVYYKSDSLTLTLYDNGDIDGDTVSVLMNGKVIIAKQGLNTKYNAKSIYIDKDTPDTIRLVMYAENLGTFPPNTGLMVVRDGQSTYEVRFSADLKTNAEIILTRRKEDN